MLLIFDFDGTLVDSWHWMASELAANAVRFGYRPIGRDAIERLRGLETHEVFASLDLGPEVAAALVAHLRKSAEAAALADRLKMFGGIADLLARLRKRGDTLALVSSNSDDAVRAALGPEVDTLFSARRCGAGVFDKAGAFHSIMTETGHDGPAVLAIGDETRDLDAADEVGIEAIAVEWGYADAALLRSKAPGRSVASVGQLADMILSGRGAEG